MATAKSRRVTACSTSQLPLVSTSRRSSPEKRSAPSSGLETPWLLDKTLRSQPDQRPPTDRPILIELERQSGCQERRLVFGQ